MNTKALTAAICHDGWDVMEATRNAVAVLAMPAQERDKRSVTSTMQSLYEEGIKFDPDMARGAQGVGAIAGSLSHSHLNCVLRNLLCGKKGCVCEVPVVTGCTCKSKPIMNKNNYDLEKLRIHDNDWFRLTATTGLPWELLVGRWT